MHLPESSNLLDTEAGNPMPAQIGNPEADRQPLNWLNYFQQGTRLLMAVIEPTTLRLRYANDYFYTLAGLKTYNSPQSEPSPDFLGQVLSQQLAEADHRTINRLYRRHLLHRVLQDCYQADVQASRLLDESIVLCLNSPLFPAPRYLECWLRSNLLHVSRIDQTVDEFKDLNLAHLNGDAIAAMLLNPAQLHQLEQRLQPDLYRVEGYLLLEGVDVTVQQTVHQITQLLIDQDAIIQPQNFQQVDRQLCTLFRADHTAIVTFDTHHMHLFVGSVSHESGSVSFSIDSLQDSVLMEAIQSNRVLAIPDLMQECHTDCGRQLLELGVRSLLLVPLMSLRRGELLQSEKASSSYAPAAQQIIGLVGILSQQPHRFDGLDCYYAEQLIPAFTVALTAAQRHLVQKRFIANIHPSVEWRFLQEAERRSLGLPPQPIVFTHVYPLYGISDIRSSSEERNRAIHTDLLEQFKLALAIVEVAVTSCQTGLVEQVRLDLLEQIRGLEQSITVDAEVTGLRYLREQVERYFDYFARCNPAAQTAIGAYQTACHNEQQCVYWARARYDKIIHQINRHLRQTWDRWQHQMQKVSPHYCDVEATDGIDHMIYAGQSIDPDFTQFHLRSLRYEQLRAMCDCARAAFQFSERTHHPLRLTHLVLVQDAPVDIFHNEHSEGLFEVRGTHDTRYEIVKKRIDKAVDTESGRRITQPGMLTIVYSTNEEWAEYQQYLRYLQREGWVNNAIDRGTIEPLQGVTGLKFARVQILPASTATPATPTTPDQLYIQPPALQLDQSWQPDH